MQFVERGVEPTLRVIWFQRMTSGDLILSSKHYGWSICRLETRTHVPCCCGDLFLRFYLQACELDLNVIVIGVLPGGVPWWLACLWQSLGTSQAGVSSDSALLWPSWAGGWSMLALEVGWHTGMMNHSLKLLSYPSCCGIFLLSAQTGQSTHQLLRMAFLVFGLVPIVQTCTFAAIGLVWPQLFLFCSFHLSSVSSAPCRLMCLLVSWAMLVPWIAVVSFIAWSLYWISLIQIWLSASTHCPWEVLHLNQDPLS